jgi:hypothetical protein
MAHSLFEPAPEPLSERVWRRLKNLNPVPVSGPEMPVPRQDPSQLDARGQQLLLAQAFKTVKK